MRVLVDLLKKNNMHFKAVIIENILKNQLIDFE